MFPFYVIAFLVAITGSYLTLARNMGPPMPPVAGSPEQLADNFFIYANAVARFVAAQSAGYTAPAGGNTVPDTSLAFPTWYVRNAAWTNKVIGGTMTVYAAAPIQGADFSSQLAKRTDMAYGAGVTLASGEIASIVYGPSGIFVPAGVPAAVPVFQVQIH